MAIIDWRKEMMYVGRNTKGIIVRVQEEKPDGYVEEEEEGNRIDVAKGES